jgi:hypothetical protein
MPKGQRAEVGTRRKTQNGYWTTKTEDGWKYDHQLVVEQYLGRPLERDEDIRFKDKNKDNLDPDNLEVITTTKKVPSLTSLNKIRSRLDKVEEKFMEEIQQMRTALDELESEISREAL